MYSTFSLLNLTMAICMFYTVYVCFHLYCVYLSFNHMKALELANVTNLINKPQHDINVNNDSG